MQLIFATHNRHKLQEIQSALNDAFQIVSLKDMGLNEDIPETGNTITENALLKAHYVYNLYHKPCFADDTGLEIEALNGRPGIYSARYAGENCNFDDNMNKVLSEMHNNSNRRACFTTVIALIINDKQYTFEGKVKGEILSAKRGNQGFGYDPIFQPEGYTISFAEMSTTQKNRISHRAIALEKLIAFLKTIKD
ncbi:MAG TPA: non-canonical purine NTP diphosphatase [Bacteroidales bacterium]|jgi:XTP/dITP diphosphohydrolase|nr:non-canonical purine NTP diphosphatase [Bacteroidales bacterium]HON20017.1 non-canonical purine NTP diphosphatase [Bacteroidales bacterium]HOR81343.1 non-canonical purine NTP diphosphatase [Bacteroidales bacterium]HPJ90821.1 non-canonical purine NTP diphosphatase [Bacteroidales bacterium]HPX59615.1 non-canonical purine NTP diphosphatase [Bacteroidales bacterium]